MDTAWQVQDGIAVYDTTVQRVSAPYPSFDPRLGSQPGFNPQPSPFGPSVDAPEAPLGLDDQPPYDPEQDPVVQKLQNQKIDLNLDLGVEREQELVHHICLEIDGYLATTDRRRSNLNVWRLAWELMPPGTANRWQNSSDIPSALTRMIGNSHHTKLNQQINATDPPFTAIPEEAGAEDAAPEIEKAMAAVLRQAEWAVIADDLDRELVISGNVFVSTKYLRETARIPERQVEQDDDTLHGLLTAGVDPEEAAWHSVKRVHFQHVEKPTYDGVKWKVIPFEDGVICPANIRDPDHAIGIGERLRVRGSDLLDGVRDGYYREEEVNELLDTPGDPEPMERLNRKDEQGLLMDAVSGMGGGQLDRLYRQYELYELCWQYDVDDDDRLEWVVVHLHKASRKIIGLRWMEYEHGKPYFSMIRYIGRTGELFGMGIPELLQPYQDADTNVTNQIVDHADLSLNIGGNFAYTRLSGYDPDKTILQLGRPLLFENLGDADFRPLPALPLPSEHYQLSQRFKELCELLTASSNPSLGKTTDSSKTLGEVQIVTNAANQIFEDYGARVARQLAKLWDQARSLTAQFAKQNGQGQIPYRHAPGADQPEFRSIAPADLKANVRLIPTGLVQLGDLGARIQQATLMFTQVMQLVSTFPPCQGNIGMVRIAWEQYQRSLKYPVMEKLMAAFDQGVQQWQQQQMLMQQAQMAALAQGAGPGGSPGTGGGGPPGRGGGAPAGALGGPPSPIPQPPEMPTGGVGPQVNFLPPPEGPA